MKSAYNIWFFKQFTLPLYRHEKACFRGGIAFFTLLSRPEESTDAPVVRPSGAVFRGVVAHRQWQTRRIGVWRYRQLFHLPERHHAMDRKARRP